MDLQVCFGEHTVVQTGEDEYLAVLPSISETYDVFEDSLLIFVPGRSQDPLKTYEALEDSIVVILVLSYLDGLSDTHRSLFKLPQL